MRIVFISLLLIILSCNSKTETCYLIHQRGDKVTLKENSTEVIINYRIHTINHDSTRILPCRYRVSWTNSEGVNENKLVYDDHII